MLLMIDNYDSFTYNIVQYFGELGEDVHTYRNDEITIDEIRKLNPERICLSPGPSNPQHAGITLAVLREFSGQIPILGVCLGHQAIGEAFGARIVRAAKCMHGKLSAIHHDGTGIFAGIPSPFQATRYHSLVIDPATMPACLRTTAYTEEQVCMGLAHRDLPIWGVQFHPESITTEHGHQILRNFLDLSRAAPRKAA